MAFVGQRGLRSFCSKKRDLRQISRHLNPASQNHDPNLFPQYMRRAVLEISNVYSALANGLQLRLLTCNPAVPRAIRGVLDESLRRLSLIFGAWAYSFTDTSLSRCSWPPGRLSLSCLPRFRERGCRCESLSVRTQGLGDSRYVLGSAPSWNCAQAYRGNRSPGDHLLGIIWGLWIAGSAISSPDLWGQSCRVTASNA